MQVIGDFKKSVEIEGPKSKSQVLGNYFKAITIAVKKDSVSKEEAFDVYLTIMPLVEENLANASDKIKASYEKTRGKIEEGLKKIIADCSEAKLAFEDSYKKRPDDPKLWKAIFSIYRNLGEECTKDPIFNEVAVKLFDQDSVAIYAIVVALNASDASTAKKYFDLAIESEEDVEKKASYAMKYASDLDFYVYENSIIMRNNNTTNIEVMNNNGQLVFKKTENKDEKVDLSHLETGLYIIRVSNESGSLANTQKVILQ